jgi:lipopolysaccharide assembly outer membrane protein LptD (OstA)
MIRSIAVFIAIAATATATAPAAPAPSTSPAATAAARPSPSATVVARPSPSRPPAPGRRASPPPAASGGGASFDLGVWTVHASSVDANFKNGDFSTPAQIVMTRDGGDVTADRANGNYKKQMVYLNGHVVMHDTKGDYGGMSGSSNNSSNGPSTLTADKAQIDGGAKEYKAIGNVHYVQGDTVVDADNGTLNESSHDLFMKGNVRIVQGARKINAQSVVYNTVTSKAHAQGDVTMQFPGQLHRGLATPKPLHVPKNGFTQDVTPAPRPS